MCRLYALVSTGEPDRTLVRSTLGAFFRLAGKGIRHTDGWGIGQYASGNPAVTKRPTSALIDPEVGPAIAAAAGKIILAHVRNGTDGGRTEANTHPFVCGRFMFEHNGRFVGKERLRQMLPPDHLQRVKGETDSELIFQVLISHVEHEGELIAGTVAGIRALLAAREVGTTALNFIVSDGDRLLAYRMAFKNREHYSLNYAAGDQRSTVVCSEPLPGRSNWTAIENGELLVIGPDLLVSRMLVA
jgi:predicted glutamine amidotransferase